MLHGLPGHRKHTNDTKINWDSGEAYQGRVAGPSFKLLYFHPVGVWTSLASTEYIVMVFEPFLAFAMGY